MKKIGLLDADLLDNGTRHPNLALMKISGFMKEKGNSVDLLESYDTIDFYDEIYISKVFTFTHTPEWVLSSPKVHIGGTGFFPEGDEFLQTEIEHHMPDYTLYDSYIHARILGSGNRQRYSDYLDFSIGFATRGCFRKCEFCVNRKYDFVFKHSPINEFLDIERPYIYLWDDNFLGYQGWEEILDELEATKKPFQFRQGLDVRLMTDRIANRLSKTRYHGDFIFAFDHIKDRDLIESKLKLWRRYSAKTTKLYVLCAFDTQDEIDIVNTFERIRILMKHGCLPYIMRYEKYKTSKFRSLYTQLARWCNQPQFFKKKSFRQFCEANQEYHKNSDTLCAAYQALADFEKDYPDIAKEYFDLRYEEENEYSTPYGYERKYAFKPDCIECKVQQKMWIEAYNGNCDLIRILVLYFTKEIDLQCLIYQNSLCKDVEPDVIARWFCNVLLGFSMDDLVTLLVSNCVHEEVFASNIPQYSKLSDAIHELPELLIKTGAGQLSIIDAGYYLDGRNKNEIARRKYGENHAKLASLLDLTTINTTGVTNNIELSVLGRAYLCLDKGDRELLVRRLILRIPVIQTILFQAASEKTPIMNHLTQLSEMTAKRRKPNIIDLIDFIRKDSSTNMESIFSNIVE